MLEPAKSLTAFAGLFDALERRVLLDFGAGNLRNALYLQKKGFQVYAVDLPDRIMENHAPDIHYILPEELPGYHLKAGLALCTFVLNQIEPRQRARAIGSIARNMAEGGYFLVETKGLSLNELDRLVIPRGFIRVHHQRGRYSQIALFRYIFVPPRSVV